MPGGFDIFVGPWYLSDGGADDLHCGQNTGTPCKTLSWLLTLAHKKTQLASVHIVTDTDLNFNYAILVKK